MYKGANNRSEVECCSTKRQNLYVTVSTTQHDPTTTNTAPQNESADALDMERSIVKAKKDNEWQTTTVGHNGSRSSTEMAPEEFDVKAKTENATHLYKDGKRYQMKKHVTLNGAEKYVGAYWPAWLAYTPPALQLEPNSRISNETRGFRASAQIARIQAIQNTSRKIMLDSGASEMFIAPQDKDLVDWEPGNKPTRRVHQADGTSMQTGPEGKFKISEKTSAAIECVLLEKLSHTVMGVAALMKAIPKCTVTFYPERVDIMSNGVLLLAGDFNPMDSCWYLEAGQLTQPTRCFLQRSYQQHIYLKSGAERVSFLHGILGFIPVSTMEMAVARGWIRFMQITAEEIRKNPPDVIYTAKGHLRMKSHSYRSTKAKEANEIETESEDEDPTPSAAASSTDTIVCMTMRLKNAAHADASGDLHMTGDRVTVKNNRKKNRLHITVHPATKYILLHFMKDSETTKDAIDDALGKIREAGHAIDFIVADGGLGTAGRQALAKKYGVKMNLVPTANHRANKAERGIDIAKRQILGMLAGASAIFDRRDYDLAETQAEIIINSVRQGSKSEDSAYRSFHGHDHDFDAHPMNIFGTRAELHIPDKKKQGSFGFKAQSVFYVGPALDFYRNYTFIEVGGRTQINGDTAMFYPEVVNTPKITEGENLVRAVDQLCEALVEAGIVKANDANAAKVRDALIERAEEIATDEINTYPEAHPELEDALTLEEDPVSEGETEREKERESSEDEDDGNVSTSEKATEQNLSPAKSKRKRQPAAKRRAKVKEKKARNTAKAGDPNPYAKGAFEFRSKVHLATSMGVHECDDDDAQYSLWSHIHAVYTETGKLTYHKSQLLKDEVARKKWAGKMDAEMYRLIVTTRTATPVARGDIPADKMISYCSLLLEAREGKDWRVRCVFGGDRQTPRPEWTSRNSDMVTKKIFANAMVSSGKKLCILDIKDFYIAPMNVLESPEYMFLAPKDISPKMREEYGHLIEESTGRLYLRIDKSIYGMRQAGFIAQKNLIELLKENGYRESGYDSIFTSSDGKVIFLTHTDDFAIGYDEDDGVERLKNILTAAKYTLVIDKDAKNFCGFQVKYDREALVPSMTLSVEKILEKALLRFGYSEDDKLKKKSTPYPTAITQDNRNYDPREQKADESRGLDPKEVTLLQEMIGVLRYIAMAVYGHLELCIAKIAASMAEPRLAMLDATKRIFQYLSNPDNRGRCLRYEKSDMQLRAVSDASYGTETRFRSRTGGFIYLGRNDDEDWVNAPIEIMCSVQQNVCTCTVEAEYVALFDIGTRLIYLKELIQGMGYAQRTIEIECDNQGAVGIATLTKNNRKMRHIAMRYHWTREQVIQKIFDIIWRTGKNNKADYATKYLRTRDEYFRGRDIYTSRLPQ
jgi:hypothetical protein